ncbi:MAG TPA: IS200/IS605 family transposase [Pirellulales bacterium]|jgi:putative transposase
MEKYRTGSHSRFDLKYHFVWITKYRKPLLVDAVGVRLRELVREICRTNELEILEGSVSRDHVHVLLSCPPNVSPSKIMQYIKGKSSRKLLMEFRHLQKAFWGRHLWARGYFVASSGNVTDEVIQEYIRQQDGTEPDDGGDNFRITKS